MKFTEIINKRFTTKDYVANTEIKSEDMKEILEASLLAPTALGAEQNRVLVFQTKEARENIVKYFAGTNGAKVENAGALILFIGQTKDHLLKDDAAVLKENMHFFDFTKPDFKPILDGTVGWYNYPASRHETLDLIGAGNKSSYLTLKATELGYNSTIMTGIHFNDFEKHLKEQNELAEGERIVLAVALGKADENSTMNKIISSKKNRMKFEDYVKFIK
jgi:nitroreductase